MYVNATRVLDVDVFSPVEFSAAVIDCYRQIDEYARFLIKKVPGFEKSRISQIAPVLGVRETRHIHGEYTLTADDVLKGTSFEDTIAVDVSAFDVHAPKGEDVDFQGLQPYEIPYRCMVPMGVEQVACGGPLHFCRPRRSRQKPQHARLHGNRTGCRRRGKHRGEFKYHGAAYLHR